MLDGKVCPIIVPDYFKIKQSNNCKYWKNDLIIKMNKFYNDNKPILDNCFTLYQTI
jgi:hypothetical protein